MAQPKTRNPINARMVLIGLGLAAMLLAVPVLLVAASVPDSTGAAPIKVGLITEVAGVDDWGFNWLSYQGLQRAQNDLGVVGKVYEATSEQDYGPNLGQCASEGNDLCISVGFQTSEAMEATAPLYPQTHFAIIDYVFEAYPANLRGMTFASEQAGYLAGALAGLMTESNVLGDIGGMEIPPVTTFTLGYRNAAQCVNPSADVLLEYADSFVDPDLGAQIAQQMIAQGADVIFAAAGPTGVGAIITATQSGAWAIGVDVDQYLTVFGGGSVPGAERLLTSAEKRIDNAVYGTISDVVAGTFTSGTRVYDLNSDGVGLAPFHGADSAVPQAVRDQLAEVEQALRDGLIDPLNPSCVKLYLDPGRLVSSVDQVVTVELKADLGEATADTLDAYLDFDPAVMEVVNAAGQPASAIELNTALFPSATFNQVNNTAGTINLSASKFDGSKLTGQLTIGFIHLKGRVAAPDTGVSFVRSEARWSDLFLAGESLNPTLRGAHLTVSLYPILSGRVALERRGSAGDAGWITELFRVNGEVTTNGVEVYQAGTSTLLGSFAATTDAWGNFQVELTGLAGGTYDISVKGSDTLGNKRTGISLPSGSQHDFGTLLVGDSTGNDAVNGADVSYMVPSFLLCSGTADYRPYADTNRSGCINGADVSALIPNFLKSGPIDLSAVAQVRAATPRPTETGLMLSPGTNQVRVGDVFTVEIIADAGAANADTVDAYIDFAPAFLEVVDAAGQPASSIAVNTDVFPGATFNAVDNAAGKINFSATRFAAPYPSGSFRAATVRFRTVAITTGTAVTLARSGVRWSDVLWGGESLGPSLQDASVIVTLRSVYLPLVVQSR